ncbi:MAG: DUF333 domain-containing protein [bacterium]
MKKFLPLFLIVLAVVLSGCTLPGQKPISSTAFTQDTNICPDGSVVVRIEESGYFAPCPTVSSTCSGDVCPLVVNEQYSCVSDTDCTMSCAWGGVNLKWYKEVGENTDCEDGCVNVIWARSADLKCISNVCHIFGGGKIMDDSCKLRDNQYKSGSSQDNKTGMANPASVYCGQKGGKSVIQNSPVGQYGLCYFLDNRACEEWAMFNGDCPVGGVKTTGYNTEAQKFCAWSGGSTFAVDNAVCKFKDGSQCLAQDFYTGLCQKGNKK